jgi:hypothetical protein
MQQTYIQHLPAGFDFTPIYGYINMNVTDQPRFAVILWLDVEKKMIGVSVSRDIYSKYKVKQIHS